MSGARRQDERQATDAESENTFGHWKEFQLMIGTTEQFHHLSWYRIDISFTFVLAVHDSPNEPICKVYFS